MFSQNYSETYIWDEEPILLETSSRVNYRPLEEIWTSTRIMFYPGRDYVKVIPKNVFGRIRVEDKDGVRVYHVIPRKLFPRSLNKDRAYSFINETVFSDILEFIGFIIQEWGELQGYELFRILEKFFIHVIEFYAYMTFSFSRSINYILKRLYSFGGVHREIFDIPSVSGGRMKKSYFRMENLKVMSRKAWKFDTSLNIMVFQTVFYTMILATKIMKALDDSRGIRITKITENLKETIKKCSLLLEHYNLWIFYEEKPIPFTELLKELATIQNPYYKMLFPYYSQLTYALFLKRGPSIDDIGEYPLIPFTHIYEVWAFSKLLKTILKHEYKLSKIRIKTSKNKILARMYLEFSKNKQRISVYWEPRFKPIIENSSYIGSIVEKTKELNDDLYNYLLKKRIKPDLLIMISEGNIIKKVYIGEIKFSRTEVMGIGFPRLKDLYKVLGYLLDLKDAKKFSSSHVEGLFIYPGDLQGRIPIKGAENTLYINILSLNYTTPDPDFTQLF